MNKKVVFIIAVLLILSITSGVSALVYHITDASERVKDEVAEKYETTNEQHEFMIKNDTTDFTQKEIKRLENEVWKYFDSKASESYSNKLNKKSEDIQDETDKKIKELKDYIDILFEEEE